MLFATVSDHCHFYSDRRLKCILYQGAWWPWPFPHSELSNLVFFIPTRFVSDDGEIAVPTNCVKNDQIARERVVHWKHVKGCQRTNWEREFMEQACADNVFVAPRQSDDWSKLIRKLRWIGMEEEAERLQRAVLSLPPDQRDTASALAVQYGLASHVIY
jgi:hypothetical protein